MILLFFFIFLLILLYFSFFFPISFFLFLTSFSVSIFFLLSLLLFVYPLFLSLSFLISLLTQYSSRYGSSLPHPISSCLFLFLSYFLIFRSSPRLFIFIRVPSFSSYSSSPPPTPPRLYPERRRVWWGCLIIIFYLHIFLWRVMASSRRPFSPTIRTRAGIGLQNKVFSVVVVV